MSAALLAAAKAADEQITAIHAAFGAPGDHGYETREGRALFALYTFQVELRAAIRRFHATAPDLLQIAKRWAALDSGAWHVERHASEKKKLLRDTIAAIAKTEGDA